MKLGCRSFFFFFASPSQTKIETSSVVRDNLEMNIEENLLLGSHVFSVSPRITQRQLRQLFCETTKQYHISNYSIRPNTSNRFCNPSVTGCTIEFGENIIAHQVFPFLSDLTFPKTPPKIGPIFQGDRATLHFATRFSNPKGSPSTYFDLSLSFSFSVTFNEILPFVNIKLKTPRSFFNIELIEATPHNPIITKMVSKKEARQICFESDASIIPFSVLMMHFKYLITQFI